MAQPTLGQVFEALRELEAEGTLERYAVVGAMAALFYVEATPTFDLDVAVLVPQPEGQRIFSLASLYSALRARGFAAEGPHVMIHGVPVQFLAADEGLWRETIEGSRLFDYGGASVRVARAEHLVAMAWAAPETKRLQRAAALLESPGFDRALLREILSRHDLRDLTANAPK